MQTLAEKFALAAKIETEGLEWESRVEDYEQWSKADISLSHAIYMRWKIRIKPLELAQDPQGRPLHNPDGLTGEQVGKGYRLLIEGEIPGDKKKAGFWDAGAWLGTHKDWIVQGEDMTYRVPIATCPWPAPAWTPKYKKAAHAEGGNARIAPWTLPPPPYGMQWHRQDWTEEMLPEGWRPALEREACAEGDIVRYTMGNEDLADGLIGHAPKGSWTFRTRRPLPSPPKMIPLGPEDVPPGSALRHPEEPGWVMVWSVCKEKVWTSATSTYTFDFLQEDKWQIKRPNGEWEKCEKLG